MTETSESYEGRHREAAEYLEQHKPSRPEGGGPAVSRLRAREYVTSRWGARPRDERDRLADAFRAGFREATNYRSAARAVIATHRDAHDALSAAPARPPSRPEDRGAEDLGSCSYLRGVGSCSFGCHSEPACITERPSGGWPSEPPPRDPAGEACEAVVTSDGTVCNHPESEHEEHGHCSGCCAAPVIFVSCGHPYQPSAVPAIADGPSAATGPRLQSEPTGETAGQGEWVRAKSEGQQRWAVSPEGVEYGSVIWSEPHGEAAIVPLAVEQAIRAPLEARATAAEAERDRLREAAREYFAAFDDWNEHGWGPGDVGDRYQRIEAADSNLRALAGESTEGQA